MSNTDKLLRAFIEASGYEVEEVSSSPASFGERYSLIQCTPEIVNAWTDYEVTKKKTNKEDIVKRIIATMEENDISFMDIDQAYNWGMNG